MRDRHLLALVAFALTFGLTLADARAWDDSKYPDLKANGAAQSPATRPGSTRASLPALGSRRR